MATRNDVYSGKWTRVISRARNAAGSGFLLEVLKPRPRRVTSTAHSLQDSCHTLSRGAGRK